MNNATDKLSEVYMTHGASALVSSGGILCLGFFDGFLLRARPPLGETVGGRLGARLGLGRLMANGVFSLFATRGKGGGVAR